MALTTINYNFQPIYYSPVDFSEYVSELHQDDDRSGFQNLGDGDNFIFRSATSDQFINAQGGDDDITLSGNTNDTVLGGSGKDFIDGGAGSDTLSGGSGNDTIFGGAGADHISGGSGDDILNGDNDAVPSTQHGADTIFGGSGNDTIYGGGKADILTGGSGADTFLYKVGLGSENESSVGAADHITDFQAGDHIDVAFMDADGNAANGNSAFTLSSAADTHAGTFWIESHDDGQHVFFNINGGAADMEIVVENNYHLTTSDFHL
jgi:Ca2+-binding RTX toxin-like protein